MSSALKPVLTQGAVGQNNQPGSSTKSLMGGSQANHGHTNVAHHPQNMSNNVPHQNMSHIPPSVQHLPQNVAQNMTMSHSGQPQLGHNAGYPINPANKNSNNSGALSLVQDKIPENHTNSNQPLALTRSPDKIGTEEASLPQSNGMSESPKPIEHALTQDNELANALLSISSQSPASIESSVEENSAESSDCTVPIGESKPDDLSTSRNAQSPIKAPEVSVEIPNVESDEPVDKVDPVVQPEPQIVEVSGNDVEPGKLPVLPNVLENTDLPAEVEKPDAVNVPSENLLSKDSQSAVVVETKSEPKMPDESSLSIEVSIAPPKEEISVNPPEEPTVTPPIEEPKPTVENTETKEEIKVEEPKIENISKEEEKPLSAPVVSPTPTLPVQRVSHTLKKVESKPKSTLKLATVPPNLARKRRSDVKPPQSPVEGPSPAKHAATLKKQVSADPSTPSTPTESRISKRNRTKVQPYQCPTPEIAIATKLSASQGRSTPTKQNDEKLIVFYKNEYLAVRNAEGGFYVCQAVQNVFRNTNKKIKIRWLSQNKELDGTGETYTPDFYDTTDMECVLTTLSLTRASGGTGAQRLSSQEEARAKSILDRAIEAEKSGVRPEATELSEEHPDGLDLSLYKDESQLDKKEAKKGKKRSHSKNSDDDPSIGTDPLASVSKPSAKKKIKKTPKKKAPPTPKKAPKTPAPKTPAKPIPKSTTVSAKGDKKSRTVVSSNQSPAIPAPPSKTATATIVSPLPAKIPKKTSKPTPVKSSPRNSETPKVQAAKPGRKSTVTTPKSLPMQPIPSTSTGKATRTPRKPPSKK